MYRTLLVIGCVTGACAGTIGETPPHPNPPQSPDDGGAVHVVATPEVSLGDDQYSCGDTVLADQSTSGGQPLEPAQPCFDVEEEARAGQEAAASLERVLARHDRHSAAIMARSEVLACNMVPPKERTHSPFAHVKAIKAVIPQRAGGTLTGVRIVFKRVPGLDAAWVRRAIECRQAQWVVFGHDPELDLNDPTLIDGATVSVIDHDGRVEVLVTTDGEADAKIALSRANRQAALAAR